MQTGKPPSTEIVESFNDAAGAVLTDYRGLTVKQLQDLRRSLGENANYAVVKNTLAKIAANRGGHRAASTTSSPARPPSPSSTATWSRRPRVCVTSPRRTPPWSSRAASWTASILDAKEVAKLADLESREVLLGKMAGAMLASLSQAVYLLNAPIAQAARLAGALQAKAEQDPSILAGGAGTPAAAEEAPEAAAAADEAPADEAPAAEEAPAEETPAAEAETSDEGEATEA